jgi:SAM-dependent methyltransferase
MTTDWVPDEVDIATPNAARVYDYYLGGGHHFPADRTFAEEILAFFPEARDFARNNRAFQHRAIRYVSEQGVDQFLDLGAGIPTVGPTHEVAREVNPRASVMYVDIEPVAVSHSELMLSREASPAGAAVMLADLRDPEAVLTAPETTSVLDLSRPVCVMILAMLHFLSDEDDPARIIAAYLDAVPPGSYLIASHATPEGPIGRRVAAAADKYAETRLRGHLRTREQFRELLAPVELVEPGIVWTSQWRPDFAETDEQAERSVAYGAVGVKR